jgi:hypothetical protein
MTPYTPTGYISTTPGTLSIPADTTTENNNYGIELPPTASPSAISYYNSGSTTQHPVAPLSGTDPEQGSLGTGMTLTIGALPTNATLYYNGVLILSGSTISGYDPALLTVDPTFAGTGTVVFPYTITDLAGAVSAPSTATIVFVVPPIDARPETYTYPFGPTQTIYPLTNDTYSGVLAHTGNVVLTIQDNGSLTGLTYSPTTGAMTVPAGTLPGTYVVTYQICGTYTSDTCDTTIVTIVIPTTAIQASPSTQTYAYGSGGIQSLLTNDTLSGVQATTTNVSVTLTGTNNLTGVTLVDGSIYFPASTLPGIYVVEYTICQIGNPTNCATSTATVVVPTPPIQASPSTQTYAYGSGGTQSLLTNDTYNGGSAHTGNVSVTL